jgi:hypothetical protein
MTDETEPDPLLDELKKLVPSTVIEVLLGQRDATPRLMRELPQGLSRADQRAWELSGLHLIRGRRFYEAIAVFEGLYQKLLEHQVSTTKRVHKGMPLVWIRDCHVNLGHTALAKRFIMLTLVEDAIAADGAIDPEKTGGYFRLVWYHGISDELLRRYAGEIAAFARADELAARYPERVLQELDNLWMTDLPATAEAFLYPANRRYVRELLHQSGDRAGRQMELLADYLLSAMPGCRTYRRQRSYSTDYDIVCSLDGLDLDFRSELGRYFVCESKDWRQPADFAAFAKFARVLDSTKSRFGILFSREGITGERLTRDASREQLKLFQDRGVIIVVVTRSDVEAVMNGANFIALLQEKYEAVRLDLLPKA